MPKSDKASKVRVVKHAPMGYAGLVAFIGAFVYFTHSAQNFGDMLWGFVQALVWPGILVFHVLTALHA